MTNPDQYTEEFLQDNCFVLRFYDSLNEDVRVCFKLFLVKKEDIWWGLDMSDVICSIG